MENRIRGSWEKLKASQREHALFFFSLFFFFLSVMIDATPTHAMRRLRQSERQQFTINGVKSYNSNGVGGGTLEACHIIILIVVVAVGIFKRAISRSNLIAKITIKYETDSQAGKPEGREGREKRRRERASRRQRTDP